MYTNIDLDMDFSRLDDTFYNNKQCYDHQNFNQVESSSFFNENETFNTFDLFNDSVFTHSTTKQSDCYNHSKTTTGLSEGSTTVLEKNTSKVEIPTKLIDSCEKINTNKPITNGNVLKKTDDQFKVPQTHLTIPSNQPITKNTIQTKPISKNNLIKNNETSLLLDGFHPSYFLVLNQFDFEFYKYLESTKP